MFVLYYAKISGERLQDHWSSGIWYFGQCKCDISESVSVRGLKLLPADKVQ